MGAITGISWTDSTWNPVTGCTRVSEGCRNCYMARTVPRQGQDPWTVVLHPDRLDQPLKWKQPRRIFVNSLSDLFHEDVPEHFIEEVFGIMASCPRHTFQVLTKRPKRMLAFMQDRLQWTTHPPIVYGESGFPPKNVWLGVSVENQETADERIPLLLQTPAATRFLSCEPLLSKIDLGTWFWSAMSDARKCAIGWAIVGGESGPGARPMHPDWARSIRDQCQAAGVPFFFKQWGEFLPYRQALPGFGEVHGATAVKPGRMKLHYGGTSAHAPNHAFADRGVEFISMKDGLSTFKVGKKAAGSKLDGREWKEWPEDLRVREWPEPN